MQVPEFFKNVPESHKLCGTVCDQISELFDTTFIAVPVSDISSCEELPSVLGPHYQARGHSEAPGQVAGWDGGVILCEDDRNAAIWSLTYDGSALTPVFYHELGHLVSERYSRQNGSTSYVAALLRLAQHAALMGYDAKALSRPSIAMTTESIAWYFGYLAAIAYDTSKGTQHAAAILEYLDGGNDCLPELVTHLCKRSKFYQKTVNKPGDVVTYHGWKGAVGLSKIQSTWLWQNYYADTVLP